MERQRRDQHLRQSMTHSLREWGIDHNLGFAGRVKQEAIRQADAVSDTFPLLLRSLEKNELPHDQGQAVKHVLRKDLEDALDENGVEVVRDTIGILWPPFRCQPWDKTKYERSNGYERYRAKELNPLERFSFETISDQQHVFDNWSDRDSLGGTVMEALVAHHVVHSGSCFHCKVQNRLRWNGGRDMDSSWADLVCLYCQSTYEIKSKKDAAALEKIFKYKELRGGSFRLFHANQFKGEGKRFVVLVSRTANDHGMFPVSIREIDSVEPVLKDRTFATYKSGHKLSLGTRILVKDRRDLWCNVPSPRILSSDRAKEVFNDHFGAKAWDSLACPPTVQEVKTAPSSGVAKSGKAEDLEDVRRALEDLHTENWEDSEDEAA